MGHHSLRDAKENLSALIDRALAGEEVVILRDGRPVVAIKAVEAAAPKPETGWSADEMLAWLDANRIRPAKKLTVDAGELLRQMRDEECR